jgi:hypothetical protein
MNNILKFKKAEALSLSTVVIAAVVLLVLVVLTIVFSTRMGIFSSGLRHCDTICTTSTQECDDAGYQIAAFYGSCKDNQGNEIKENSYCCKGKRAET